MPAKSLSRRTKRSCRRHMILEGRSMTSTIYSGHNFLRDRLLRVCPTENRSGGNLREKFFGARDEHTISSLLSRAKVSAAAVPVGLAGGGASGLFHCGNRGHAGGGRFLRTVRRRRAS